MEPKAEDLEGLLNKSMYYLQNKKGDEATEIWDPDNGGLSKIIFDSITVFYKLKEKHKTEVTSLNTELSKNDTKSKQLEAELETMKKIMVDKNLEIGEKTARLDEKDGA
jgi:hypothetical protein